MRFFLGTHHPNHLWDERAADVDLFVSHGQLRRYKSFKPAVTSWACDSRGFTELSQHGRWTFTAKEYAAALARYSAEIGRLAWASPQDWMCEPFVTAKTGLTVEEHQRRTVDSVLELRALGAPVIPVLQGWTPGDYDRCFDLYEAAGVDLRREPIVGLGSICRRQNTMRAEMIVRDFARMGVRLHGHSYRVTVLVRGPLNAMGWVVDFAEIDAMAKPLVDALDHRHLNDLLPNPTSELLAVWFLRGLATLPHLLAVRVSETSRSSVTVAVEDLDAAARGPGANAAAR